MLKAYLENEYFSRPISKTCEKMLRKHHKNYSFPLILSFLTEYKSEILRGIKDTSHLNNRINWYLENKMEQYQLMQAKNYQPKVEEQFNFISYNTKPTPAPIDYDIL